MKTKLLYLLISLFFLNACSTSSKFLSAGDYDAAIQKSVQRLKQNKSREKEIMVLHQAYHKANSNDLEQIAFLEKESRFDPDIYQDWDAIYRSYMRISKRQQLIKPLLPLTIGANKGMVQFEVVDYNKELIRAKYNAADYLYMNALKLLDKKNRADARKAWYELQQVKNYYPEFRNVDDQMRRAASEGTSRVLLRVQNQAGDYLPDAFFEQIVRINVNELSGQWVNVDSYENLNQKYDYTLVLNIHGTDVSPETFRQNFFIESREVQDGFSYVFDSKGNVKKDSLGNDIKIPKFCMISCSVLEVCQQKKAMIRGSLEFINNGSGQLIGTDPVWAESIFEHRTASATGNLNALCSETRQKLGGFQMAFPSDHDMLLRASEVLKAEVKRRVRNSHGLLN